MDWLLDTRRGDATATAVKSLEEHLLRHTSDESFVGEAVQAAQTSFDPGTDSDLLWLHLDWSKVFP